VEQRLRAVLEVLNEGASVSDVARRGPVTSDGTLSSGTTVMSMDSLARSLNSSRPWWWPW
jgi:transposase-like protein